MKIPNSLRNILIMLLGIFILVNIVSYKNDLLKITPSSIKNIFNGGFYINKAGLDLFIALLTILSILIALYQWLENNEAQRKADINGLLEEIHHNFNTVGTRFGKQSEEIIFPLIYTELQKLSKTDIYPNPSDLENCTEYFLWDKIYIHEENVNCHLIALRSDFINTIIRSRNIFTLKPSRMFLNIGHLKYSIDRHNNSIYESNRASEDLSRWEIAYSYTKKEYYEWVYFRMAFLLIDLISNIKRDDVLDTVYYDELIKYKTVQK